ncbi:MAG: NAD-dependent deacylase [Bacteroidales bacterium]|nr:NAD-dependent deacylase [Bacteroidales bacterium]
MKKIRILTGAGISAESGIPTFRDANGLWKQYRMEEISSLEAWLNHPEDVLEFYNMRRRALKDAYPNRAHLSLVELEKFFDVYIITQNVDDLHERAGSSKILHLHGELTKARSSQNPNLIIDIGYRDIILGEKAPDGSLLRPHIVWFGEDVPLFPRAVELVNEADIFLIIGTSLVVYPAASLIYYCRPNIPVFLIDPKAHEMQVSRPGIRYISEPASTGVPMIVQELIEKYT